LQALDVVLEKILSFGFRQMPGKGGPGLWKEVPQPIEEPLDLPLPSQEDSAQDQGRDPGGMRLSIGQRQGGAPRAAEDVPAIDAAHFAQALDVSNQILSRVFPQFPQERGATGPPLIEDNDAIGRRIEEAPMIGCSPGAGASMEKEDGLAVGLSRLFPVKLVQCAHAQAASGIGLDGWKKSVTRHEFSFEARAPY